MASAGDTNPIGQAIAAPPQDPLFAPYHEYFRVYLRQPLDPLLDEDADAGRGGKPTLLGIVRLTINPARTAAAIRDARRAGFMMALTLAGIAILVCVWLARRAVAPLRELARATERVAGGDLQSRVPINRHDEIGDLGAAFNRMTDILADSQRKVLSYQRDLEARVEHAIAGLRHSEARFRTFMDNSPALAFIKDQEGHYLYVNPRFRACLPAVKDWFGKTDADVFPADVAARLRQHDLEVLDTREAREFIESIPLTDNRSREWWVFKFPLCDSERTVLIAGMGVDITERRHLEEQLRQSQKIDAVGRLAGGIAHDFNNILTTILGYSDLLIRRRDTPPTLRSLLEEIHSAAERAAGLTSQLLAFSRKQILQIQTVNINSVIGDIEKMLRRLIGEHIRLVTRLRNDIWPVKADPAQLHQVFLNLAINARDAMPNGGTLTISSGNVTLDDEHVRQHPVAHAGEHVCISVEDTGVGMSEETLSHLFEPFFTTKGIGKGTGLGLATCYGIIEQSGGHIKVTSRPGCGAAFLIFLPRATGQLPLTSPVETPLPPRGHETLLVVEDEAGVRKLAVTTLRELGYRVLEAGNGREALELLEESGLANSDLLVTDIVMPVMGGRELAATLSAHRPGLKVLYVTGYAQDVYGHDKLPGGTIAIFQKPYEPADIAREIRAILDESPAPVSA
jgi:PAS domain S-box-containing protein